MDDDCLCVQLEVVRGVLSIKDVLHVEDRQVHLVHSPVYQFGKFLAELLNVVLFSVQMNLVASRDNFKSMKIRTELFEYLVTGPENLDGVDGVKSDCFLHYLKSILYSGFFFYSLV